ncbi:hypothetical protein BDY19DRAFT_891138 [Irpex rosettiformis]|uniref:Uncharacterized protein n=1 Tax=Irpex rosettiformis TaxID=378272 RepID=A0ACB8U321_9APHY|nr:hypothetical protein BDY19DRAFT_891138 [Irpex rosettiformis]
MSCSSCPNQIKQHTVYRCKECWNPQIYCSRCIVDNHFGNPLHVVEEWSLEKGFWTRRTLGELGMVINLGDHGGKVCDHVISGARDICVVTLQGVQDVRIQFCGCGRGKEDPPEHYVQLLEVGLWPGSWKLIRTAFSLDVLDSFRRFSTQGNITALDFYTSLVRQTDGVIPTTVKNRYREFLCATREHQFVKWCMRKGMEPTATLSFGCLSNLCPACPHIDINIDPGWETRSEDKQYLDALYHAVDGNFTQNMKDKGTDIDDLPLTLGAAYFADELDTKWYFSVMPAPQSQNSSCNKFGAMGYYGHWGAVSGLVGLSCARHMFVMPGGGVDLKLGETWAAVDLLMLSGLQRWMQLKLHISAYDINCQYRIKFWERLEKIQKQFSVAQHSSLRSIRLFDIPSTRAGVGKFHEPAHKLDCRLLNSFHYLPGAGQTDGEAPERIWASTTSLGIRTREMTPGHRHDTINYFHDDMNWRRTYGIASSLVKKCKEAIKYEEEISRSIKELEGEINAIDLPSHIIDKWNIDRLKWDEDLIKASRPPLACQLSRTSSGLSDDRIAEIQRGFSARVAAWNNVAQSSLGVAIAASMAGLAEQRRAQVLEEVKVREDLLAENRSIKELEDEINAIDLPSHIVDEWNINRLKWDEDLIKASRAPSDLQATPQRRSVLNSPEEKTKSPGTKLSRKFLDILRTFEIHLPSSYPLDVRTNNILAEAVKIEMVMRREDASDALDQVRAHLAATYGLGRHQAKSTTQQQKLRNRGPSQRLRLALNSAAKAYRRARNAMVALGMDEKDPTFQPLKNSHLKSFVIREEDRRWGDSKATKESWIWESLSFVGNDFSEGVKDHIVENLRVHWCRTKAKADRWAEEKALVLEEMKRTLRFFDFQVHLWKARANVKDENSLGPAAYALKQAFAYQRLLEHSRQEFKIYLPYSVRSNMKMFMDMMC